MKRACVLAVAAAFVAVGCQSAKTPPASGGPVATNVTPDSPTPPVTNPATPPAGAPAPTGATPGTTNPTPPTPGVPIPGGANPTPGAKPIFDKPAPGNIGPSQKPSGKPKPFKPLNVAGAWTITTVDPMTIASRADNAMFGVRDTVMNANARIMFEGVAGHAEIVLHIRNKAVYNLSYPIFHDGMYQTSRQRSDGAQKVRFDPSHDGMIKLGPVAKPGDGIVEAKLPDMWWLDFPRLYVSPWAEGRPIFGPLVKSFKQAGYTVTTSQTEKVFSGHKFQQDRIVIERPPAMAKVKGEARTELVFDRQRGLPVTLIIQAKNPNERPINAVFPAGWEFQRQFPDKEFKI